MGQSGAPGRKLNLATRLTVTSEGEFQFGHHPVGPGNLVTVMLEVQMEQAGQGGQSSRIVKGVISEKNNFADVAQFSLSAEGARL